MNITFNNFYIQIKLSERSRTRFKILIAYYSTLTLEVLFTFSNFDVVVVYIYFFRTLLYHYTQIEHIPELNFAVFLAMSKSTEVNSLFFFFFFFFRTNIYFKLGILLSRLRHIMLLKMETLLFGQLTDLTLLLDQQANTRITYMLLLI